MSELVSKCVLRVEVNDSAEDNGEAAEAPDPSRRSQGLRSVREISVSTFPSKLETPRDDWGLLPSHTRETTPMTDEVDETEERREIGFFSGNPFVELTKGILHLYKEDTLTSSDEALTLCLIGVPNAMACNDLLVFTAPCHSEIAHIRVIRDSMPNQYMALLTFRQNSSAREFYDTFNGAPFNSLEPDVLCRIVWVSQVEWAHDDLPPPGHTELPTCPVCLERMDESVDGVLTILCNHTFHADCLEQWTDATCPVCRCVQSPETVEQAECESCVQSGAAAPPTNQQQAGDPLWICLICGHVGCGRYQAGHAAGHYRETGHCYALQVGAHRVWDYKGDNFVHRLLQNKADGKLVPSEGPIPESERAQEKVDSVQLEFTYLLTSQLDEQRMYFEDKLALLDYQSSEHNKALRMRLEDVTSDNGTLQAKVSSLSKEKQTLERKLQQQSSKLSVTMSELNEERQLGKAMRSNQQQWQNKIKSLEENFAETMKVNSAEIAELKEQVRDLMFFIDAKNTIEKSEMKDEIASGSVTVGNAAPKTTKHRRRKKE